MTDKHIIDGCNVSWCPYYHGYDVCKNTCHYFDTPCEWVDVQNCDYKKLKRAEQTVVECHKYQAELEDKLETKEQECEGLKKERDSYIDKYFIESQKVLSLRKVLKEIKALSERDKEFCIKCNGDKETDCIDCIEGGRALLAKEILRKISEVEDG